MLYYHTDILNRSLVRYYGHFMRDLVLDLFYQLHKRDSLNKDFTIYIQTSNTYQMRDNFREILKKIFENVIFINEKETSIIPSNSERLEVLNYGGCGGDLAEFPKLIIDDFRNYCLKKYKIDTSIKKQILYVPRSRHSTRFIPMADPLVNDLKIFCKKNNYSFVHWVNAHNAGRSIKTMEQQMTAYAQSEIIIGAIGSDFVNSYWANKNQLIIEIFGDHYSGFCAAFYSEDINNYLTKKWEDEWIPKIKNERLWRQVFVPKENIISSKGKYFRGQTINTSQENRNEILDALSKFIA